MAIPEASGSLMETVVVNKTCAKKLRICADVALRLKTGSDSGLAAASTSMAEVALLRDLSLFVCLDLEGITSGKYETNSKEENGGKRDGARLCPRWDESDGITVGDPARIHAVPHAVVLAEFEVPQETAYWHAQPWRFF